MTPMLKEAKATLKSAKEAVLAAEKNLADLESERALMVAEIKTLGPKEQ
jgi:hypothetical protein